MKSDTNRGKSAVSGASPVIDPVTDAESTLRLIASLPAPEGLEDRVHARVAAEPLKARILSWPPEWRPSWRPSAPWIRSAAAAAIVFVVVGGGWGVYSRVQSPRVIVMPARIASPDNGLSPAGAMRTPTTANPPVLVHPGKASPTKPGTSSRVAPIPVRNGGDVPAKKSSAKPVVPASVRPDAPPEK
jgi:hypothetical protein